jgi:hypothetical protein
MDWEQWVSVWLVLGLVVALLVLIAWDEWSRRR